MLGDNNPKIMNKQSTIEVTGEKRCLIRLNICKLPHSPLTPHNEVDATNVLNK
jgi:hypothetical protein